MNLCEPFFAALMQVAKAVVLQAELVRDCRVEVAEVVRGIDGTKPDRTTDRGFSRYGFRLNPYLYAGQQSL